jgi:HK97 family phage major capsid protein
MGDKPTTIEERDLRVKEIDERLAQIDEEYANVLMPDHVREEWNVLNSERDEHAATVAELRRRHERLQSLAGNSRASEVANTAVPSFVRHRGEEIYDMAGARFAAHSEEDFRERLHENARRAIDRAAFPAGRVKREAAQERALELLETLDDDSGTLARRILQTGSPVYQRAFGKAVAALSTNGLTNEEQRALSIQSDPAGGFAVPFDLDPSLILSSDGSSNPLRQISRVEMTVGKEWQGLTSEGITVSRVPEVQEATDANPVFVQPVVRPSAVHAFIPFSMDLDMDWSQMRTQLTRIIQDGKDNEEADSFVNGDGSLISGGGHTPDGIAAGLASASEVPGGASFTSQDLYDMEAGDNGLGERFLARASWLANRSIYNLIRQLDSAGGADLWVQLQAGQPPELIGYPTFRASAMPKTATGRYLILGDFSQYLIVDRVGMSVDVAQLLFGGSGATHFPTGQRGIYARWRNSTKILVDNAFRVLTDNES